MEFVHNPGTPFEWRERGPQIGVTEPTNAVEIWILGVFGAPSKMNRLTGLNVYRHSNEHARPGDNIAPPGREQNNEPWLVGTVGPRGGRLVDKISRANLAPTLGPPYGEGFANELGYFLGDLQWYGNESDAGSATAQPTYVTVEDTAAQAEMALRLNGGSGVIETSIQGGEISAWDAYHIGRSFLEAQGSLDINVTCSVKDPRARPGQVLDIHMPEPIGDAHLKIQSSGIQGFELGVAHEYNLTAAVSRTTLEDLLKAIQKP
jgi:hypothetical protein